MSNIYVKEPATNGKVLLKTTVGEIEIELWSKEAPLACRNFVQLCMEGYYNSTAFHRIVKGFIVQGGDPSGTGDGGTSIYGAPFKTECHSRLSFNRRGLVGMACPQTNCNDSQFFFTLGEATELNGKHTLFGRIIGNTLFNMLRLGEVEVIGDDKPARLHMILKTEVIVNPYDDIVPRRKETVETEIKDAVPTAKRTKNFSLLSFGEEAEEEEELVVQVSERFRGKGKSAHDLANDARLSAQPFTIGDDDKLAAAAGQAKLVLEAEERRNTRDLAASNETAEERAAKTKRLIALRLEADEVRKDIARTQKASKAREMQRLKSEADRRERDLAQSEAENPALLESPATDSVVGPSPVKPIVEDVDTFRSQLAGYKSKSKRNNLQVAREANTLAMLDRFQNCLTRALKPGCPPASEACTDVSQPAESPTDKSQPELSWLRSRLLSEDPVPARKVLDPSLENPDRYDLYDPRNPLNVRKREGASMSAEKGSKRARQK